MTLGRTIGPAERRLVQYAVALVSDPDQSVGRGDLLIGLMDGVLASVDRLVSVEVTAIAFAAEDLVAARRSGPTWEARRRMARAVHNYFMRVCAADEACDRTGQGDRDVA
jgi:hypothetical protein